MGYRGYPTIPILNVSNFFSDILPMIKNEPWSAIAASGYSSYAQHIQAAAVHQQLAVGGPGGYGDQDSGGSSHGGGGTGSDGSAGGR